MTKIHAVRVIRKGSGSTSWYWDEAEAYKNFYERKDAADGKVELFRLFAEDIINYYLDDILNEQSEVNFEKLTEFDPDADVTFTELEFRPEGHFYIEMLKASTSEYWPFRVESNGALEDGYTVYDHTEDRAMGIIVPSNNAYAFKAAVNGYEADQQFTNLKGVAIHIIREFNG